LDCRACTSTISNQPILPPAGLSATPSFSPNALHCEGSTKAPTTNFAPTARGSLNTIPADPVLKSFTFSPNTTASYSPSLQSLGPGKTQAALSTHAPESRLAGLKDVPASSRPIASPRQLKDYQPAGARLKFCPVQNTHQIDSEFFSLTRNVSSNDI